MSKAKTKAALSSGILGGHALMSLQALEPAESPVRLHIDVYSAQTGISRFQLHVMLNLLQWDKIFIMLEC